MMLKRLLVLILLSLSLFLINIPGLAFAESFPGCGVGETIIVGHVVNSSNWEAVPNPIIKVVADTTTIAGTSTGTSTGGYSICIPSSLATQTSNIIIQVSSPGYIDQAVPVNLSTYTQTFVDVYLALAGTSMISVEEGLHHLGDSNFSGSINAGLQILNAEGTTFSKSFSVMPIQTYPLFVSGAALDITINGAQSSDPVVLNGTTIAVLNNTASGPQSFSIPFDPALLVSGTNTITVSSVLSGDYDDFEFSNVRIRLVPLFLSKFAASSFANCGACATARLDSNPSFHGDPVNTATGSHVIERTLMVVNGAQPIALTARYDSQLLKQGPLGKGWGHNFETYLELLSGEVVIHWTANRSNKFINDGSNNFSSTEGAIKADKLVKNVDGTYTLTRKDSTILQFNTNGKLTQHKNRIGQALNLAYYTNGWLGNVTEPISGKSITLQYYTDGSIAYVTDPLGRKVQFAYDSFYNLTGITDANNKTYVYTYNPDGRVLTGTDAEGNRIFSNVYDADGRVISQDDALTSTTQLTTFNYDVTSQPGFFITTVTDRTGNTKTLTHDSNYNLISLKDALSHTVSYTYDGDGNRLTSTDPNGNVTTYAYDTRGNITSIKDPKNRITTMTYDGRDNLLTITNSAGKAITYTYDANSRVLSLISPLNQTITYTYNTYGKVATVTDPKSTVTTNTYANGLLQGVVDPVGNTTSYTYDVSGRVVGITNSAGKTTTMQYDAADNLTKTIDPLGRFTTFIYDSHGNKLTSTDHKGGVTSYTYNGNGKLISFKDALNQITTYQYDPEDRLTKIIDPLGNSVTTAYDAVGRPVTVADALNNTITNEYDTIGNLTSRKDAYGNSILTSTFDPKTYMPLTVKDALLNTVTYGYDSLDRVTSVLDPLNRTLKNNYDDLNRIIATTDPQNGVASQTFDENGNRITLKDPNNNQAVFDYDAANRLTAITNANGHTQSLIYENGRLIGSANARNQTTSYTYYDDGRIKNIINSDGIITYTYDANGNVLTISENGKTLIYTYDSLNRITSYTDENGNILQYAYDAAGNLTTLTYPDNKTVIYQYNANNLMIKVTDWNSRITSYTYDKNGRLLTTVRPDASVETRKYDAAGRLTQLKDSKVNGTIINQYDYTYDTAGNITSAISATGDSSLGNPSPNMTYGADNRLVSYNGTNITYDADGNMTTGPLMGAMQSFSYDSRSRLISVAGTTYAYDSTGNRIKAVNALSTINYVINPVAKLSQLLMETDSSGVIKAWYVYGVGLIGRQEIAENSFKIYHYDRRGSTVALTSDAGVITDTYTYAPYGELLAHTGSTSQPFLYNGRDGVMSDANGLYHMRTRYYNPQIKRFINMDALIGGIDDGQTLNRYAYVNGTPIDAIDPTGMSADSDINNSLSGEVGGVNSVAGMNMWCPPGSGCERIREMVWGVEDTLSSHWMYMQMASMNWSKERERIDKIAENSDMTAIGKFVAKSISFVKEASPVAINAVKPSTYVDSITRPGDPGANLIKTGLSLYDIKKGFVSAKDSASLLIKEKSSFAIMRDLKDFKFKSALYTTLSYKSKKLLYGISSNTYKFSKEAYELVFK